jgi:hypothetical protein
MSTVEESKSKRRHRVQLTFDTLQELFAAERKWYVWVVKYSITHSVLELAVHEGSYPRSYYQVLCLGTHFFAGRMRGGPFHLELTYREEDGRVDITILGDKGELTVKCGEITSLRYIDSSKDIPPELPPETAERLRSLQDAIDASR